MEFNVILICSILLLSNVNGRQFVRPTDETILDEIIREDAEEGLEEKLLQDVVQCPPPTPPENGYFVGPISTEIGATIHLKCNHSYYLLGGNTIQCQAIPNPFMHEARWFHRVGTSYYNDPPKCIKQISPNIVRSRNNREEELKEQLHTNTFIANDEKEQDVDESVPAPKPMTSQGGPKKPSDERVHFPTEEEHENTPDEENTETKTNEEPTVNNKPKPDCHLPAETGPCKARKERYYFDTITSECKMFIYGGCQGNGNNYFTKENCESVCKKGTESDNFKNST